MLSSRITARCSSAKVIGIASVPSYVLEFSKKSIDGSGKATLIHSAGDIKTPGVLFEIETGERETLDKFEGAGKGYDRLDEFRVIMSDEFVTATTYLASARQSDLIPFDWYLSLLVAGALEHELGNAHVDHLRKIACIPDQNKTRKSRLEAFKALANHGYNDQNALLTN